MVKTNFPGFAVERTDKCKFISKKNERNMYYRAVVNEIVDIFKKGTLISTNINETTDSCLIVGIF